MLALIGQKKTQSQRFLENGTRIPVTLIDVKNNTVMAVLTNDKNKYQAVQLGFSMKKNANKAEIGHAKGANLEKAPKFLREVRVVDESETLPEVGSVLIASEVFTPGDMVDVSGFSKGKGFAGGVKRHGFSGGPKTHGQSDRHRAPGSIGQGTTPGRVYRGKKMAGKMGNENVTIQGLEVIDVTNDGVLVIKGLVPGIINGLIMVKKVGEDKNFVPLQKTPEQLEAEEKEKLAQEALAKEAEEKAALEAAKVQEEADKATDEEIVAPQDVQDAAAVATEEVAAVEVAEAIVTEVKAEESAEEDSDKVEVVDEAKTEESAVEVESESVEEVKEEVEDGK